jgi:hypothetical protein
VTNLTLKLALTPILIGTATLAARRWGPTIGGWLVGLPLTSGPVSVFLALEQGRPFTAIAARASILGLVGVAAFCVAYARAAARFGPALCLPAGFAAYAAATVAARYVDAGAWGTFLIVCAVLAVSLALMPRVPRKLQDKEPAPWWDLPLRILAATAMVLLITTAASALGPTWSGLLSPFPVFSSVLAAFAHYLSGPAAAARLQRGVVIGIFSFAAFFLVVTLLVEEQSLVATYTCAAAAAAAVNGSSLLALRHQDPQRS